MAEPGAAPDGAKAPLEQTSADALVACQICGAPQGPDDPILCRVCGEPVLVRGWAP